MNFCTNCGKSINNKNNRYCTYCGALLADIDYKDAKNGPKLKKQKVKKQKPKLFHKSRKRKWSRPRHLNVAFVFWLVCCIYVIVTLLMEKNGINPETLSQFLGRETVESAIRTAYDERASRVAFYTKDLKNTYGGRYNITLYLKDQLIYTPEYYLIDRSQVRYSWKENNENFINVNLSYHRELDTPETKARIEAAANELLSEIPEGATDWEKAKIIHDGLVRHVTYEKGTYDNTIYGALVEGKAVCSGFAVTYQYLLEQIGIPCDIMSGYVVDDERNDYGEIDNQGLRDLYDTHAWNIVTLTDPDGSRKEYIVDVTWDNSDQYNDNGEEYIGYSWFLLSLSEFRETGRLPYPVYDYDRFDLSSRALNYYVQMDAVITDYDINHIANAMQRQLDAGNNVLTVCWDDTARFLEAKEKIKNGDISEIIKRLDYHQYKYNMTENRYENGKNCLNVYVVD